MCLEIMAQNVSGVAVPEKAEKPWKKFTTKVCFRNLIGTGKVKSSMMGNLTNVLIMMRYINSEKIMKKCGYLK